MTKSRALIASLLLVIACTPAHSARPHQRIEPLEFQPRADATPPDFSRDANVSVVAKNGNSWETGIAISAADPNVMVLATIDSSDQARVTTYRSEDGGVTWSDPQPQPLTAGGKTYARSADPVVVAGAGGDFYLAQILIVGKKGTFDGAVIGVSRSADGGRTWSAPRIVIDRPFGGKPSQNDDKEWIAVDPESGRVTVAWAFFLIAGNNAFGNATIYVAHSDDRGATWSAPSEIRNGDLQFTQLAALRGGTVVLSYADYPEVAFRARTSSDGGLTFGDEVTALPDPDIEGWILPNSGTLAVPSQTLAADPSRGMLYLIAPARNEVLVTRSADGGKTWSTPQHIAGRNVLLPALSVDPVSGDVVVSWYDRRDDSNNVVARIYASRSVDGGASFSTPRAFTSPFSLSNKMGDYEVAAASGGRAVRAFSTESGHVSVARFDFTPPPRRRAARP